MTLIKTSLLNGLAVIIRILTIVGLNKVLAVFVGPAGYAIIGQLSNLLSVSTAFAAGFLQNGITKYTAEYSKETVKQEEYWRAASKIIIIATSFTAIVLIFFRNLIAREVLGNIEYEFVIIFIAAALPFVSINTFLLAIMNGKKQVRRYIAQNIIASILSALFSAFLAYALGLKGALIALAINQALAVFITISLFKFPPNFLNKSLFGNSGKVKTFQMLGFGLMSIVTAIISPLSQIIIRRHIIADFGEVAAGEWQAVYKISEIYLMLFTATLSIYYLPRLSELKINIELIKEIKNVYAVVLPFSIMCAISIFTMKNWIIINLFSAEFIGMTILFKWQLIGDVLKIGSWILSFLLVAKAMVKWYVISEIIFSFLWVALTIYLTSLYGVVGATIAFSLNYFIYWIFIGILMWFKIFKYST